MNWSQASQIKEKIEKENERQSEMTESEFRLNASNKSKKKKQKYQSSKDKRRTEWTKEYMVYCEDTYTHTPAPNKINYLLEIERRNKSNNMASYFLFLFICALFVWIKERKKWCDRRVQNIWYRSYENSSEKWNEMIK